MKSYALLLCTMMFLFSSCASPENSAEVVKENMNSMKEEILIPELTVIEPANGTVVTADSVVLNGELSGTGAKLLVNNQNVTSWIKDGKFAIKTPLKMGANTITLVAKSGLKSTTKKIVVNRMETEEEKVQRVQEEQRIAQERQQRLEEERQLKEEQSRKAEEERISKLWNDPWVKTNDPLMDSGGNAKRAIELTVLQTTDEIKKRATAVNADLLFKAPYNYYGKVVRFDCYAGIVNDYPPDSGGLYDGETGTIICASTGGQMIQYVHLGSTGDLTSGRMLRLYGLVTGKVDLEKNTGGSVSALSVIGKLYERI